MYFSLLCTFIFFPLLLSFTLFSLFIGGGRDGMSSNGANGGGILKSGSSYDPNRRKAFSECNADSYEDNDGVVRSSRVDATSNSTVASNGSTGSLNTLNGGLSSGHGGGGGHGGGVVRSSRNLRYEDPGSDHHYGHTSDHVSIDVEDPTGSPPAMGIPRNNSSEPRPGTG